MIENATFPYKTALPIANAKTNRIGNAKQTYHKERGFAPNQLKFLKFNSIIKTS